MRNLFNLKTWHNRHILLCNSHSHHIKKRATLCVVLFLCVGKQHRARIRRVIRLCANHCAPVPRSHCMLASKCKHFRFAVIRALLSPPHDNHPHLSHLQERMFYFYHAFCSLKNEQPRTTNHAFLDRSFLAPFFQFVLKNVFYMI